MFVVYCTTWTIKFYLLYFSPYFWLQASVNFWVMDHTWRRKYRKRKWVYPKVTPRQLRFNIGKSMIVPLFSALSSPLWLSVRVIFWNFSHSCGYQKAFMEYSNILQQKYPEFRIHGEYYESNGLYTILAKLLVSISFGEAMLTEFAFVPPKIIGIFCIIIANDELFWEYHRTIDLIIIWPGVKIPNRAWKSTWCL